ncbi:MAG: hypothetical protein WC310_05070 [Patescibacteria group bacterium]|jgi:hypothetical protein
MKLRNILLTIIIAIISIVTIFSCDKKDESDDDGDDEMCIKCHSTSECVSSFGQGWGCVDDCCLDTNIPPTDDDNDNNDNGDLINIALGQPVIITDNGVWEVNNGSTGYLTNGKIDGDTVGYQNFNTNEAGEVTITVTLLQKYRIQKISYNQGNCLRADVWNADLMTTPFGTTGTLAGTPHHGAWTSHTGETVTNHVAIILTKTRLDWKTDWLSIGEIQIWAKPQPVGDDDSMSDDDTGDDDNNNDDNNDNNDNNNDNDVTTTDTH